MELKTLKQSLTEIQAETLGLLIAEDQTENTAAFVALSPALKAFVGSGDFIAKEGQVAVIYTGGAEGALRRVILCGLGASPTVDTVRRAAGLLVKKARELKLKALTIADLQSEALSAEEVACAITEGAVMANYAFYAFKSGEKPADQLATLTLTTDAEISAWETGAERGKFFGEAANLARDLVNTPPDVCTPEYLANTARKIGETYGLKVETLGRAQIEALRMGAFLAVARGSDTPPRFIIMEHNPDLANQGKTIVLIGKGVTFDTGGYSLKTVEGIVGMKADMSGAAAVIASMQAIARLKIPLHVVALVPAADNMVSGNAYRPEEVLTAANGKTIEVISTDAEGRLLLADALVYASRYKPAAVVDIATLTGACVVALGHVTAGVFATDDALVNVLNNAADATHEKVWRMPLYPEYRKYLESPTADMRNVGGREGGAITAAVFLKEFVDYPAWAHIDMAGMMANMPESPYIPAKGATGYGARLLAEFVRQWANQ